MIEQEKILASINNRRRLLRKAEQEQLEKINEEVVLLNYIRLGQPDTFAIPCLGELGRVYCVMKEDEDGLLYIEVKKAFKKPDEDPDMIVDVEDILFRLGEE